MFLSILLLGCVEPYDDDETPVLVIPPTPIEIGPEGGLIEVGDLLVEIPADAVPNPVEIVIYDTLQDPPSEYDALSTVWSFEPHGLIFNSPITVSVPFSPSDSLAALHWSNDAGGYDRITATREEGRMVAQIEHFSTAFVARPDALSVETGELYPPADILFVIDNSCSMIEEQARLADNIPNFIDPLLATGLDVHIGVISTDMEDQADHAGKLQIAAGVNFIDADTPTPSNVFGQMANMGVEGSFEEKGRAAAYSMVELKPDIPRNEGFYRPEATLSFIFVSDEEDQSAANPVTRNEFRQWMETKKQRPEDVVAHGFFFIPGSSCPAGDTPGAEYQAYVNWTGGVAFSMCETDWSPGLVEMIEPLLDSARVDLPEVPEPASVVVFLDDEELTPDSYTLLGSAVYFDQGLRPAAGQVARVDYLPL